MHATLGEGLSQSSASSAWALVIFRRPASRHLRSISALVWRDSWPGDFNLCQSSACKRDSFLVALGSGPVEPMGALLAATVLRTFRRLSPAALAFAGGVMVFLTLDELVPTARQYGHQHYTAIGIILGAVFVLLPSGALGV